MKAFLYGIILQWKLDIRSKTLLITCYIVPLLFFALMGNIFIYTMPEAKSTLIQTMTIFGVTMGAFIGLPPSLVEIYGSDIKKVYKANGVPLYLGLVLTTISAFLHLFIMSLIIYLIAPIAFQAQLSSNPIIYFNSLMIFIAVSLSFASIIGLAVKDQTKTSMFSILYFLPSILLSGIMFPINLLPSSLELIGKLFPASWGYPLLLRSSISINTLFPLLLMLLLAIILSIMLLHKSNK